MLARRRKTEKPDSPLLAGDLAQLARNLLMQQVVGGRAAPRECLVIREKALARRLEEVRRDEPARRGAVGQGRYAEAEPLVVPATRG